MEGMPEPSEVIDKAKELYTTTVETVTDPELYKGAVDTLTDPELYANAATKAKDVYTSASTLLEMNEIALLAVTVIPALFAAATILVIILRKIFCCPRSARISPAALAAPARPALVSRPTVIARGKKDAPFGSIGHATLGQSAKNPRVAPAAAKAGKPPARGGPPSTSKKGSGKGFSA